MAVSKRQPMDRVRAAYDAGHRDFGENFVQALVERAPQLPDDAVWHMIGHLQRNKAKPAAAHAQWVHTVDSLKLAKALAAVDRPAPLTMLIQVNVAGEVGKFGVAPDEVEALTAAAASLPGLQVTGFMLIPPLDAHPWTHFEALRGLRDRVQASSGVPLPELSMGMTADFEHAIAAGATIIRVGTGIFGSRDAG